VTPVLTLERTALPTEDALVHVEEKLDVEVMPALEDLLEAEV
jgi:hypothetical protein